MELQAELVDSVPTPVVDTPSQETPATEVTPVVEATAPIEVTPEVTVEITAPTEQLYTLPDGRQVDATTLAREWKDNFYPDYTRKSQELSALKTPQITNEEPPWKDPNYSPKDWAEVIELAKSEVNRDIIRNATEAETQRNAINTQIETQIGEIKATDPKLDEDALFEHATKYGFTDLRVAYTNMKDIKAAELATEQRVLKNLGKHGSDPVATRAGAPIGDPIVPAGVRPSDYRSAADYLAAIKK